MTFRDLLLGLKERRAKVLVVGLGISGIESAKLLTKLGLGVVCAERESEEAYMKRSKFAAQISDLLAAGVDLRFGVDGERVADVAQGAELCVLSPGVSLESAVCGALKARHIKLVSELELGIELLGWPAAVVTGSNGKSTTVSLIHAMLMESGFESTLCGNVGTPVISGLTVEQIERPQPDPRKVLVVEASSYQLESCSVLKPKVGALLNISDNHLERHGTLARYFAIKSRLFERQTIDDFAVLNADDEWVAGLLKSVTARPACFGVAEAPGARRELKDSAWRASIHYDRRSLRDTIQVNLAGISESYDLVRCKLLGIHNRYNLAAAILSARLMGADARSIQAAIDRFEPLEHRLELTAQAPGLIFINDSKSTTVAATVAAFSAVRESYPDKAVGLMIGGLSKAGSWQPLLNLLAANKSSIRPVVCFGQDANILSHHCRAAGLAFKVARSMKEGLATAVDQSGQNDVILLSPGCASFDEFTDFEDRGNVFKSLLERFSK